MSLRPKHLLLLLPLLLAAGCRLIYTILMIPVVVLVMVASIFVGSEGLTDQDELRAGGIPVDQHLVEFEINSNLTFEGTVETVRTVTGPPGLADAQKESLLPGVCKGETVVALAVQEQGAVATPVSDGSLDWSHSTVTSGGHVRTGGVVSTTLITCTQLELLPQASVAVHVRVMTDS